MIGKKELAKKSAVLILGGFIGFSLLFTGCKASAAKTPPDGSQHLPTPASTVTAASSDSQSTPTSAPTVTAVPNDSQDTPTPAPTVPDFADADQNTWIWDTKMISSDDTIKQLLKYHIDDAYVYYSRRFSSKFNDFIGKSSDNGIKVEALMGSSDMALSSNYDSFEKQINTVLDFNKNYSNRFEAVHLDIEPYTLPDWDSHMKEYLTSYLDNLKKIRKLIDRHNQENNDTLKMVLDIPFWYYQKQFDIDGVNIIDSLFEVADELVIMNYTKNQSDFISRGISNLSVADKHPGKTMKIGMEFQPQVEDVTLYEKTPREFQQYISDSLKEFSKHEAFAGYAIHYLNVYVDYLNKDTAVK